MFSSPHTFVSSKFSTTFPATSFVWTKSERLSVSIHTTHKLGAKRSVNNALAPARTKCECQGRHLSQHTRVKCLSGAKTKHEKERSKKINAHLHRRRFWSRQTKSVPDQSHTRALAEMRSLQDHSAEREKESNNRKEHRAAHSFTAAQRQCNYNHEKTHAHSHLSDESLRVQHNHNLIHSGDIFMLYEIKMSTNLLFIPTSIQYSIL